MQLLYKQVLDKPYLLVRDDLQALSLLQDTRRKIAYFQSVNSVNYEIRGNCSYMWLGAEYFKEYLYLGYQKNLSFADALSYYIVKARDTGILKKLRAKWWGKESSCTSSASFYQLGFSKTISAFVVLAIGAALGVLILLFEVSLYYLRACGPVKQLIERECLATRRKQRRRRGFKRQRLRVFY
ncbi:uncharacterized protein [Panulirus ornatus]|uniref:uncharacterized protein n=1 Tax=Panulirus ornatus TaxID=150431 RepID=UPI003A8AA9DF